MLIQYTFCQIQQISPYGDLAFYFVFLHSPGCVNDKQVTERWAKQHYFSQSATASALQGSDGGGVGSRWMDTSQQRPVPESRFSENSEFVNPEMRGTLGFPFQKER